MSPFRPQFAALGLGLLVALLVCRPVLVKADDEITDPAYETEVRVPGPRVTPVDDTPGFAVEVDAEDSAGRVTSVGELVEQSPGVTTRSLGGLGGFATVSVRGSAANQVLILLDGVPLSTARFNQVDVNALAPDLLERVEVYRSGAPIWLGAAPMGAVVNLVTRDRFDPTLTASGSWGSFDTRKLTLVGSTPLTTDPDWGALLGLTYFGTNGDFVFYDDRGTPFNPADDGDAVRSNNGIDNGQLLVRTHLSPSPNVRLGLQETARLERRGVPGLGQNQSDSARYEGFRSTTHLTTDALAWPVAAVDTRARLYADVLRESFADPQGEIGLGRREIDADGLTAGAQLRLSLFPAPALDLDAVLDGRRESYVSVDRLAVSGARADARRLVLAPALSVRVNLFDRHLILSGSGRVEAARSRFDGAGASGTSAGEAPGDRSEVLLTGQAGFRVSTSPGPALIRFHGTFGRFARLPTLLEMFGDTGAVIGNPALQPETTLGGDLGVSLRLGNDDLRAILAVAGFAYRYDDLIQLVQNSQRVARAENIASARIDGVEVGLDATGFGIVGLGLSYTLTDSADTSQVVGQAGRQLPGRPRHVVRGTAQVTWSGLLFGYDLDVESGNVLDRAGFRVVPERVFHGARLGYTPPFLRQLSLLIEAENLLDHRVEEVPVLPQPPGIDVTTPQAVSDYFGFPLPGRTVFVTVRWESRPSRDPEPPR